MSQSIGISAIPPEVLRYYASQFIDQNASIDGDGANFYAVTVPAGSDKLKILEANKARKVMTIINLDTALTVYAVKTINNTDQNLPILPQGSIEFRSMKIGSIKQCSEYELEQDILICEYMGDLRMSNPGATDINVFIVESSF